MYVKHNIGAAGVKSPPRTNEELMSTPAMGGVAAVAEGARRASMKGSL